MFYIARHGEILNDDTEQKIFEHLSECVTKCRKISVTDEEWGTLIVAYSKVSKVTNTNSGVNGRSVLDTLGNEKQKQSGNESNGRLSRLPFHPKRYRRPLVIAFSLLVIAIGLQLFTGWVGRISDPSKLSGSYQTIYYGFHDLLPLLLPTVWGGIGSCVYLMKSISDKLSACSYVEARLKGDGTRIFLGAILGILVVQVFFPNNEESLVVGDIEMGPLAVAFVAGLGIKPVYAAFEAVVEGLSNRISGKNSTSA